MAQEAQTLTVAIHEYAPCVIKDGKNYKGLDIDIWEEIARQLKLPRDSYRYKILPFSELLTDVAQGNSDLAMAGITITHEREKLVDFSHHYLNSDLKILINSENQSLTIFKEFILRMLRPLLYLIIFVIICGHLLWGAERGMDAVNDKYFPGIFEGMWLTITTMTTVGYGDFAPKRWSGRLTSSLIMVVGISFYGWAIANMTDILEQKSSLTSLTLKDLNKSNVFTKSHSTSEIFLTSKGINYSGYDNIEEAINKIFTGKNNAVVFDEAALKHFIRESKNPHLQLLEENLDKQYYGIALQKNSSLRKKINIILLKMKEDGTLDKIKQKWL